MSAAPSILPAPPYRLHADFLQRHRRRVWAGFLAGAACAVVGVFMHNSRDPGQTDLSRREGVAVYCLIAVTLVCFAWRSARYLQFGKLVIRNGREALCRVVAVKSARTRLRTTLWHDYSLEVPSTPGQGARTVKVSFPDKARPLFVHGDHVLVLVVDALPKHPLMLHSNLWPLALTADDMQQVVHGLQNAAPEAGWHLVPTPKGPRLLSAKDIEQRARSGAKKRRDEYG